MKIPEPTMLEMTRAQEDQKPKFRLSLPILDYFDLILLGLFFVIFVILVKCLCKLSVNSWFPILDFNSRLDSKIFDHRKNLNLQCLLTNLNVICLDNILWFADLQHWLFSNLYTDLIRTLIFWIKFWEVLNKIGLNLYCICYFPRIYPWKQGK